MRHLVASCGPEVGYLNGLGVRHGGRCRVIWIAISSSKGQHVRSMGEEDEDLRCVNNRAIIEHDDLNASPQCLEETASEAMKSTLPRRQTTDRSRFLHA